MSDVAILEVGCRNAGKKGDRKGCRHCGITTLEASVNCPVAERPTAEEASAAVPPPRSHGQLRLRRSGANVEEPHFRAR